jgi:hypothetical protein
MPKPRVHAALHVAIEEQLAIDQPPGIRAEFERILARRGDRHDALHAVGRVARALDAALAGGHFEAAAYARH